MKGSILMPNLEQAIEKVCKFAFIFSNVDTVFVDPLSNIKLEYGYNKIPESLKTYPIDLSNLLKLHETNSEPEVIFHSSSYKINYISAKVYYGLDYLGSMVVGPYILEEPNFIMIQHIIFENNLPISLKHIMQQYYLSLPLLSSYKAKSIAEFLAYVTSDLNTILHENSSIGNLTYNFQTEYPVTHHTIKQDTQHSIALIEKRYSLENEFMHTIENGDREHLDKLLSEDLYIFDKIPDRTPNDPLRSRKDLTFVLNTLLRKAAEKGGLPPLYLHNMSERFAIEIEKTSSIQQIIDLHKNMYLTYCDAVKKFSLKEFNYFVRKGIEFIRLNLDQDLSLEFISNAIHQSPYEFSRQFKKETGETITEYINKQRINEAIYIMENEKISITDIAHKVGFNDINYFTKVFKKIKGITPSQYRKVKN